MNTSSLHSHPYTIHLSAVEVPTAPAPPNSRRQRGVTPGFGLGVLDLECTDVKAARLVI